MDPRIVAVVVTYNRSALAERIVRAIAECAPAPDLILVVDNASTDDTTAVLSSLSVAVPVEVLTQSSNTGGAGGFAAGLAAAVERGADLIWLMDDDGVPAPDSLGLLLPHVEACDFVGPAVVTEGRPEELCFPVRVPGRATVLRTTRALEAAATDGLLRGVIIPFNGVLVTRSLVERIGLPRAEFFIWGDDVEYLWRARAAGAVIATVVEARFSHPSIGDLGSPMMFGRTSYNHTPSDLKHYCMVRNNITNLRTYVGWLGVLAFVVKTVWFYSFTRPSWRRLLLSARSALAAFRGDFSGHRRFVS